MKNLIFYVKLYKTIKFLFKTKIFKNFKNVAKKIFGNFSKFSLKFIKILNFI